MTVAVTDETYDPWAGRRDTGTWTGGQIVVLPQLFGTYPWWNFGAYRRRVLGVDPVKEFWTSTALLAHPNTWPPRKALAPLLQAPRTRPPRRTRPKVTGAAKRSAGWRRCRRAA